MSLYKLYKKYETDLALLVIMLILVLGVGKINYDNGRIEQCHDLGLFHTHKHGCVTCEKTGREMFNGECLTKCEVMKLKDPSLTSCNIRNNNPKINLTGLI